MKENILYIVEILISVTCTIIYEYVLYVNIQKQDFTVVDSQLHVVFWVQLHLNIYEIWQLSIENVQILSDNHLKYY